MRDIYGPVATILKASYDLKLIPVTVAEFIERSAAVYLRAFGQFGRKIGQFK